MFSQLSVRAKITTLVSIMLFSIAALGAISLFKMQTLNFSTVDIASNWLPATRELGNMRTETALYRNTLRAHLIADTEQGKADVEKSLAAIVADLKQAESAYAQTITLAEERKLYEEWRREWDRYAAEAAKVMAMSRKSIGKFPTEASDHLSNVMAPINQQVDKLLRQDIDFNNHGAEVAMAAAASTYSSAFFIVFGILAASVVVGVGASVVVIRDVTRSIASIVKPMQDFTHGDLSADVPHRGQKTEIGMMADALQIFKEALIAKEAADAAAAKEAQEKIARGQRVDEATRRFESSVGEIVETVSSASTELEASASTLSTNTDRAQELTTSVAA
ncbi:HAMP domain-containing protein, partial [Rhodopseudomonas faecalis]